MRASLAKFYAFLDRPLYLGARVILLIATIPLLLTFTKPLWQIEMRAPQYPSGLHIDIYAYKVDSGHDGLDLKEINNLNHYIGMQKIDRAALADLDWLPFALGLLVVLTLRCAALGNVRSLVDLSVISGYIGMFALGKFIYKMYVLGHNLDPDAPFKMEPFTPAIFGTKHIANFTTRATPQLGSMYISIFFAGILATLGWHLIAGRRAAIRAERAGKVTDPTDKSLAAPSS